MLYKRKQLSKDTLVDVIFLRPYLHKPSVISSQGLSIGYEYHKGPMRSI